MIKRVVKFALYVLPALIVLAAFAAGHLFLNPETDRLQTYRIANGLVEPLPEPPPVTEAPAAADQPPPEMTPDGQILEPGYHYFSFTMPFTGNLDDTRRLYSMEISVSVFDTPFRADAMTVRLTEMEAQLRPYVVEALEGVTEEGLQSKDARNSISDKILETLNSAFTTLGENIVLKSVVVTNLIFT